MGSRLLFGAAALAAATTTITATVVLEPVGQLCSRHLVTFRRRPLHVTL